MSKKESLQLIEVLVVVRVYIVMSRLEIGIICSEKNIEHFSKKYYMFQMAASNKKKQEQKNMTNRGANDFDYESPHCKSTIRTARSRNDIGCRASKPVIKPFLSKLVRKKLN